MQYFAKIWNNLYQNHEAGGINLILICIRVPQVKGKLWLTFFAQSRLPGCQQNLANPVRPSGGNQGGVWFSLWLDRKYGFLFRINRTSQGPVHQPQGLQRGSDHNFWITTWNLPGKTEWGRGEPFVWTLMASYITEIMIPHKSDKLLT